MGNICQKDQRGIIEYDDFCPLRIATLYVDLDESINKKSKIDTVVEYFMKPHCGYNLDVLCIQGVRNTKILKELVHAFKKSVEKHNDDTKVGYNSAIYLEYYPDIDIAEKETNDMYWSTSEADTAVEYYDKLVISRHRILQSADVHIGSEDIKNTNTFETERYQGKKKDNMQDTQMIFNNSDSDEIANIYKYAQIVNLNVDGTLVSIYNVELKDNSIGISNTKERKRQIQSIKRIVNENRKRCLNPELRQFAHGDDTFIACNRDLHIVTGMFHINELKNNTLSSEYMKLCNALNCFDVHKWVLHLRKDNGVQESNIRFTKDTFTMMISKGVTSMTDISSRSHKLFEDHKTVIISSHIAKSVVDMNQFTNYPEDTIFMLYRPNIEHFTKKSILKKGSPNGQHTRPTKFMDQTRRTVMDTSQNTRHPKYGDIADHHRSSIDTIQNNRYDISRDNSAVLALSQKYKQVLPSSSYVKIEKDFKLNSSDIEMIDINPTNNEKTHEDSDTDDEAIKEIKNLMVNTEHRTSISDIKFITTK